MFKVRDLNYKIGPKYILQDLSFEIKGQSFVGILGPNGSGKSTFLRHLYRAIPAHSSCIYFIGKDICEYRQDALAQKLAVMRQENATEFDYSVLEMTLLGRAPYLKPYESYHETDYSLAVSNLEFVGMLDCQNRRFSSLSGGEKQRVYLARALTQEADVLLLDEPMNHLDAYYKHFLMRMVKELGKTIIMVMHDLDLAYRYCDFIYLLNDGRLVASGPCEQVLNEDMIKDVFCIKAEKVTLQDGQRTIVIRDAVS